MCKSVDMVFAGSPNLIELCSNFQKRTYLLPTGVKMDNYTEKVTNPDNLELCLGWIGNGLHYESDLINILYGPLIKVASEYRIHLKLIGTEGCKRLKAKFDDIVGLKITYVDSLDWSDYKLVDNEMSEFDIGLYPLVENKSNSYKCGFKALEYYSKKIPVVSSDVSMNKDIVIDGVTGFIARNEREWINAIVTLIRDSRLRAHMGYKGRINIKKHFEMSKVAERFKKYLNETI